MEAAASPDSESLEKKTTTKRFDGPNIWSRLPWQDLSCVFRYSKGEGPFHSTRSRSPSEPFASAIGTFDCSLKICSTLRVCAFASVRTSPRTRFATTSDGCQAGRSKLVNPRLRCHRARERTDVDRAHPNPCGLGCLSFCVPGPRSFLSSPLFLLLFSCTCILLTCQDSTWKQTQALPKREHANGTS